MISYFGMGKQDETLKDEISEIVENYNHTNGTSLSYLPVNNGNYWSVRDIESNPTATSFYMFVVYDDQADVIAHNPAEERLVESILDAMQENCTRNGYFDSARMSDDEDDDEV